MRRGVECPTVCDNTICIADLLHLPGQSLYHVLGNDGWKTEITVEQIVLDRNKRRPALLGGYIGSLPESFILDIDLSTTSFIEKFDCGGPHAFALAHEMIRRANESDDEAWMKRHVLQSRNVKESDFSINRPFDAAAAKNRLVQAWKGESTPNPEYSTDRIMHMWSTSMTSINLNEIRRQQAGVCNCCRRTGERLKVKMKHCARCKNVNYCGLECQRKDWKTHKKVCFDQKKAK